MDKEEYAKHKAFAGAGKPSMKRRRVGHDYGSRRIYLITIVVEGRRPLLGTLAGRSSGASESGDAPRLVPSPLGERVLAEWNAVNEHHPEVTSVAVQLMPDHLHGILFVHEAMDGHLGTIIRGFKAGCNKAYRELASGTFGGGAVVGCAATLLQPGASAGEKQGLLFERGYNDQILEGSGQLQRWIAYLHDNPRRLMMKREHPDLFRVHFDVPVAGCQCTMLGNRFLIDHPDLRQVQCSRSLTEAEIESRVCEALRAARLGAVHVSPAISPGEKRVMRALLGSGERFIYLVENGLTPYSKPGGELFEACARGQLLIVAPRVHHNERTTITHEKCWELNDLAAAICR